MSTMNTDDKIGGEGRRRSVMIGPVALDGIAILAPLSGVTDVGMRRIARRHGASLVVSEMVASDDYVQGSQEARLRAEGAGVDPHVVQIAGCDAGFMASAARLAEQSGAAIIDINMGCPAKRVTGGWAGSALMREPHHALALAAAVKAAVSVPVTVKMRLGWDHASLNAADLARRLEDLGAAAVTVHGRTRQQFYKGSADWDAIARVVEAVSIPVVANGDIGSVDDARRCLAASGADAVMIGRAAVGRPWLVGRIAAALAGRPFAEPDAAERRASAVEHYRTMISLYGPAMGVRHARKHLAAYEEWERKNGGGLDAAARQRLLTSLDPSEVEDLVVRAFPQPARAAA
jgi:tRNA-dihydrouridine synthase B